MVLNDKLPPAGTDEGDAPICVSNKSGCGETVQLTTASKPGAVTLPSVVNTSVSTPDELVATMGPAGIELSEANSGDCALGPS